LLASVVGRYAFPRGDLRVAVAGVEVRPALALGSWVAFRNVGGGHAMAMGDLVLTVRGMGGQAWTVAWCDAGNGAGTWAGRRARRPSGIPIMNRPIANATSTRVPPSRIPHPASRASFRRMQGKHPTHPGYPAARIVAPLVAEHLEGRRATARGHGFGEFAPRPSPAQAESLVDVAFWASLRREEGRGPKVSLAFVPPELAGRAMVFERSLPLTPRVLTRLAPAVERPGIHLGVSQEGDGLRVWGTTRSVPNLTFVLETVEPGLLVLKYRRCDEFDKYGTIAVLEGDRVKVVDESASSLPDCPSLLTSLLGFDAPAPGAGPHILVQLAVSMRAHGRGGLLIVVPERPGEGADEGWHASVVHPIPYRVTPYAELPDLLGAESEEQSHPAWREKLQRSVDAVGGLTAVDGATVLNDRYELLAFGVKLARKRGSARVERVAVTAPVVGNVAAVVEPSRLGGTRHLSAAQFVHDQRDALALVASQDGRFTVFAWSPCEDIVHAHRVEALLM